MSKKTLTISIISIIILALIGGGVVWYVKQGKQESNGQEQEKIANNKEEQNGEENSNEVKKTGEEKVLEKVGIDENGWNIYWSEKYEFEIKYPSQFKISGNDNTVAIYRQYETEPYLEDGDILIEINFYPLNKNLSIKEWFENNIDTQDSYSEKLGNKKSNVEYFDFHNFEAVKHILLFNQPIEGSPGIFETVYFMKDKVVYSFKALIPHNNKNVVKLFDQIIEKIKFDD